MKAVIQRVTEASVTIDGQVVGEIGHGILLLLGVCPQDGEKEAAWLADKVVNLRIFTDSEDKMNLSLMDVGGEMLVVSQFTLYGDCKKGRRPSYTDAARPEIADPLYQYFVRCIQDAGVPKVATGRFGADMKVALVNDGPVTLILDTAEILPKK